MRDKVEKGRGRAGSSAKITKEIADEIRVKYETGTYKQSDLGREYLLSRSHISDIVRNKKWKT